jgi:ABC-2 type transport system ATP-binding protein
MPVIEVHHLAKAYGRHRAVEDVSFEVQQGEIFGVLGPNGAGKSTTVECIAGLRKRDAGTVRVLGVDPERERAAVRRAVGVQLQNGELPEKLRVGEALELYASFYAEPTDPAELIAVLGLEDALDTYWGVLSGGQKQRLSIALALIGGPTIAILDELTTGLGARPSSWSPTSCRRPNGSATGWP